MFLPELDLSEDVERIRRVLYSASLFPGPGGPGWKGESLVHGSNGGRELLWFSLVIKERREKGTHVWYALWRFGAWQGSLYNMSM